MRIIGLKQKGSFATHCLIENEKFLVNIDGLEATDVVPHACSGITVYNALEKIGSLRDGEWLAVMGCGGLALNAIAIAGAMGFKKMSLELISIIRNWMQLMKWGHPKPSTANPKM